MSGCAATIVKKGRTKQPLLLCSNWVQSTCCPKCHSAFSSFTMQHSPFTVAGMSSSTSSHNSPNLNAWGSSSTGGPLAQSFGDSLSQSRSHYQSGYLMVRAIVYGSQIYSNNVLFASNSLLLRIMYVSLLINPPRCQLSSILSKECRSGKTTRR